MFDCHRELGPPQQAKRHIREIFVVAFLNQTDQSLQATDVGGSRRAFPRQGTRKRTEFRRGKSLPLHNLEEFIHDGQLDRKRSERFEHSFHLWTKCSREDALNREHSKCADQQVMQVEETEPKQNRQYGCRKCQNEGQWPSPPRKRGTGVSGPGLQEFGTGSLMPAFCQQSRATRVNLDAHEALRWPLGDRGFPLCSPEPSSSGRASRGPSEFGPSTIIGKAIPDQKDLNPWSRSDLDR